MTDHYLVDTHAHLCDALFDPDRAEVLERAQAMGVTVVVAVGEDLADARRNLDLAAGHPILRPAAGLYPTHLDLGAAEARVSFIRSERERLVAVGEVGLDHLSFPRSLSPHALGGERESSLFRIAFGDDENQ